MTTLTTAGPSRARRTYALAEAETRLLVRNRTALFNSVLLPLLLVAAVPALGLEGDGPLGPRLAVSAVGITLVFLTYYNLVTTFVARREELVLQRMRTGELSDAEVLLGTAAPTLLVTVGQVALVLAGTAVIGEWAAPVDVVLPLAALLGGAALMVLLAAASAAFTRTAESAQITTLPLVMAATALSGLFFPLSTLPEQLGTVARLLPLTPVVELAQLGLAGRTWDGELVDAAGAWAAAPLPLAVLAGWLAVGAVVAPRVFRWAPRR
ncbi:ABC transporter permease [Blastococcus sp. SYSU D00669]